MKVTDVTPRQAPASGAVTLYGIGDMHFDLKQFNREKFLAYRDLIIADDNAVAVFVGDIIDGRTPGKRHFDPSNIRTDFLANLASYVNHALDVGIDYFKPITDAGVPLVIVMGNHDAYLEEVDFPAQLSAHVGARYLSAEGILRIQAGRKNAKYTTKVHVSHGFGGGRKPGSKINSMVEMFNFLDVDVIMAGHVHDGNIRSWPAFSVPSRGELKLSRRDRVVYRCPSFVERAIEGTVHYSGAKGYASGDERPKFVTYNPQTGRAREFDPGL